MIYDELRNSMVIKLEDIDNIDVCIKTLNDVKIEEIRIRGSEKRYSTDRIDISFLNKIEYPLLVKSIWLSECYNSQNLYRFKNIAHLGYRLPNNEELDLSKFANLNSITTSNLKGYKVIDNKSVNELHLFSDEPFVIDYDKLNQFKNLQDLRIDNAKPLDFARMSPLKELKTLVLTYGKIINIESIYKLEKLDFMWILYNRTLTSLEGLSGNKSIKKIYLDCCSKLKDISEIGKIEQLESLMLEGMKDRELSFIVKLKKLKRLTLMDCGEIPSVQFVEEMPNLKSITVLRTNIKDGNLMPLKDLAFANVDNKRHYNMKSDDLPTDNALKYGYFANSDDM